MNLEQIQQRIPHRPPFLWLDEVVALEPKRIVARKRLDADMDVFAGHFPAFPVFPGVLQCEAAFQAAAVLIASTEAVEDDRVPVVTRISDARFRRMVRPGDVLTIEVELQERLGEAFYLVGRIRTDAGAASRVEFTCTAAKVDGT